jgi:NAD(P)H-hydrate epimerase
MSGSAADASALLRVAQMEEADRLTVQAGTPGIVLMQNAGSAVAREIARRWSPRPTVVLCGPGNNGGDGFVIARVLAAAGWPVRLALAGSMEQLRGDARHHALLWQGPVEPLEIGVLEKTALVVDAVFGSGLRRPPSGETARILEAAAERRVAIVAVDVPSGLLGDTGESLGAVPAALTVTFTRKKPGHVLLPGRDLCGETVVADIGTSADLLERIPLETWENDPALWRGDLPQLRASGNKYSRGHALLWGGYPTTGAARMASIMVRAAPAPADLDKLLADKRFNALLIGPGAGVDAATQRRALAMLATRRAVLLDADAISAFAQDRETLFAAVAGPCVLTPHDGEFARLFDASGDKLARARAAARTSGAVIVLKGADTVIAAPDGRAVINSNAPATLATAGSGDVLGGMILGLLAQGMEAFAAAAAGVWLHGAAAGDFGPGLLAEDLPDLLPGVLRRLLA